MKTVNLQTDEKVLCQQPIRNKLTSAYDPIPYIIAKINSSQITATNKTRTIKRHITFFKRYKSASSQYQHQMPRSSITGRALSPSMPSIERDQSDSDTIPYQLDSDMIPYQLDSDTIPRNEPEEEEHPQREDLRTSPRPQWNRQKLARCRSE